jgi:AbrB family looped-hinge helix DNA binding protein
MLEVREHVRTLTSKGQVTIPAEVRRLLKIGPLDKVVFRIADGRVELQPAPMTLEATFGAVTPINRPEDFAALRETAITEHTQKVVGEMKG